jgi:hypothetical protein
MKLPINTESITIYEILISENSYPYIFKRCKECHLGKIKKEINFFKKIYSDEPGYNLIFIGAIEEYEDFLRTNDSKLFY